MGAREFELGRGAILKIDPLAGDSLRVRSGEVWLTQHEDSRDYLLKTGDSMVLSGKGLALATACQPTLLDLFRPDPARVREPVEREPRPAQAQAMGAWIRNIFAYLKGETA
jgi:DUF2917 family protein